MDQWTNGRNGRMRMARAMAIDQWEWQRAEESEENGEGQKGEWQRTKGSGKRQWQA